MSEFEKYSKEWVIRDKTAVEAGYVNDPDDPGGETNHGITVAVAEKNRSSLEALGWDGTMANLTKEHAYHIYDVDYWSKLKLDSVREVSPMLADKLFDIGINCGAGTSGKMLQRLLNVFNNRQKLYPDIEVDGGVGNVTIGTLNAYVDVRGHKAVRVLLTALLSLQGAHYVVTSEKRERSEKFTYGWMDHRVFEDMNEYMDQIQ